MLGEVFRLNSHHSLIKAVFSRNLKPTTNIQFTQRQNGSDNSVPRIGASETDTGSSAQMRWRYWSGYGRPRFWLISGNMWRRKTHVGEEKRTKMGNKVWYVFRIASLYGVPFVQKLMFLCSLSDFGSLAHFRTWRKLRKGLLSIL